MADQYYTRNPESESRPMPCEFEFRGRHLRFLTDAGVFSKGELDTGTRLLLDALPAEMHGEVLDLGCGWGPIGISVQARWPETKVVMTDVNLRALERARENAARNGITAEIRESDGFSVLSGRSFDVVITNPPIRAGKQVIYRLFADAAAHLKPTGSLFLVIRKQQGAESCLRYLRTMFASVEKLDRSGGFWVLEAKEPFAQDPGQEALPQED